MAQVSGGELRAHWESVGGDYTAEWDPPARSKLGDRELDFIVKHLTSTAGRRAMDVGIGSGRILSQLIARTEATEFYGLDIAQAMVDSTRERLAGEPRLKDLAVCNIAEEPVPFDVKFDCISAIRMLKYNANWRDIVAKLVDRLEPNGVLVFSMTNRNSLNRIGRAYAVPFDNATKKDLQALCDRLGLRTLEITGFTKLPHFVYSAKSEAVGRAALGIDHTLDRVLGGPALAREIFVAAQRS